MPKSWGHNYSNSKRRRGKKPKDKQPKDEQPIVPTNLPPVEENKPNNGQLTEKPLKSFHDYIKHLMEMDRKGIKPIRSKPTKEDLKNAKMSLLEKLGMEMWKKQNERVDPLEKYFNEKEGNYIPRPISSPSPSPDPSPSPSPSPSPTERPDPSPNDEVLFNKLTLPDIRDKAPPISGGKSRRIFRRSRKMDSRRRKRRITRKRT